MTAIAEIRKVIGLRGNDEQQLPDNEEAWVHVTYADPAHGMVTGVLTWENCD